MLFFLFSTIVCISVWKTYEIKRYYVMNQTIFYHRCTFFLLLLVPFISISGYADPDTPYSCSIKRTKARSVKMFLYFRETVFVFFKVGGIFSPFSLNNNLYNQQSVLGLPRDAETNNRIDTDNRNLHACSSHKVVPITLTGKLGRANSPKNNPTTSSPVQREDAKPAATPTNSCTDVVRG